MCKCLLSGCNGCLFSMKRFLQNEKNASKNKQVNSIQKKNGDIEGFIILVFITEIPIIEPNKYAPLSPKNISAFGKLYFRKITIDKAIESKM